MNETALIIITAIGLVILGLLQVFIISRFNDTDLKWGLIILLCGTFAGDVLTIIALAIIFNITTAAIGFLFLTSAKAFPAYYNLRRNLETIKYELFSMSTKTLDRINNGET